jgi:hypothetical protein
MPFRHDSTNIKERKYEPMPEGEYNFVIQFAEEKKSSKGNDMVELTLSVIEHEEYHGKNIKHYVVFLPAGEKGDGISVHFRKCIGVPYGGDDEVDASTWIGKKLVGKVKIETREYEGKQYENNKIAAVYPYGGKFPEVEKRDIVPF